MKDRCEPPRRWASFKWRSKKRWRRRLDFCRKKRRRASPRKPMSERKRLGGKILETKSPDMARSWIFKTDMGKSERKARGSLDSKELFASKNWKPRWRT